MSNGKQFHLGMSSLRNEPTGVKALSKTFYLDLTDLVMYLDRIMPPLLSAAEKQPDYIKAVEIIDEFLAIEFQATNDINHKLNALNLVLGDYFNPVANMVHSKVSSIFGGMNSDQFNNLAQYISYAISGYGVLITVPTAEWVE